MFEVHLKEFEVAMEVLGRGGKKYVRDDGSSWRSAGKKIS